eukprot:scaffold650_cov407-Prasinococcus_capsulatus_cf.AAC.43
MSKLCPNCKHQGRISGTELAGELWHRGTNTARGAYLMSRQVSEGRKRAGEVIDIAVAQGAAAEARDVCYSNYGLLEDPCGEKLHSIRCIRLIQLFESCPSLSDIPWSGRGQCCRDCCSPKCSEMR